MATDELDALVFRMALESVHPLHLSFGEKAAEIAARSRGILLFDVRIEGDAEVQRVAAIQYSSDQMGILALDKQGSGIRPLHDQWRALKLHRSAGKLDKIAIVDAGHNRHHRPRQPFYRRLAKRGLPAARLDFTKTDFLARPMRDRGA
ncbi:hypothetical protein [Mesorhizobium sp. LNHC221B00]|uniref:hypothetical protein n=1 Tax=Mesorhizobium sp. LNHC221B00 TaxID=1287233 RepID=UPI001FD99FA3|nr:hypothetical protein [Mesorhizobium sp. LNHC221B00]